MVEAQAMKAAHTKVALPVMYCFEMIAAMMRAWMVSWVSTTVILDNLVKNSSWATLTIEYSDQQVQMFSVKCSRSTQLLVMESEKR